MHKVNQFIYDAAPNDFWSLLKPRVMSLSIFTAFCAMVVAPGRIHWFLLMGAVLCIALGAGAAGCLNMWCEIHRDTLMKRTQKRPLPAGKIDPNSALAFGMILTFFSVSMLGLITNWLAASLLAFTIAFYVIIYTLWLKPRTPQNIVIGGASGALPPVIGWAAMTGDLSAAPWVLFLIIFCWTPAHFWALCMDQSDDYAIAGFPMYPAIYGEKKTKDSILFYVFLTILSSIALLWVLDLGFIYQSALCVLGLYWLFITYRMMIGRTPTRTVFFSSIIYLFFLFLSLLIDHLMG